MLLRYFLQCFLLSLTASSAMLISSCHAPSDTLQGYIEGDLVYLSSQVNGSLIQLKINRGDIVVTNMPLALLNPEPEQSGVDAAKAAVLQATANFVYAKQQLDRFRYLVTKNAAEQALLDQTKADYDAKYALIQQTQAQLKQAEWQLAQKPLIAPTGGIVFDTYYRVGETVPANHPILSILAPQYIDVIFFAPETTLSQLHIGSVIYFSCDACPKHSAATISYISPEPEYTPPVIYSDTSRQQLVYRIRAKPPLANAIQFHPGQPVDVTLQ